LLVPVWYFFAIGPACILGNKAFSFCGFPAAVVLADRPGGSWASS
jgi:hypothetical protein